jgi:hypothetical protein
MKDKNERVAGDKRREVIGRNDREERSWPELEYLLIGQLRER